MWIPIESPEGLPVPGTRESSTLDFKRAYGDDSFEIAKDVAAFANAEGGTLLIGAAGGDTIVRFEPMSDDDAIRCARSIEEAVRDRCRPSPLLSLEQIRCTNGVLLAVNVWPMLGQLVGTRVKSTELACGPRATRADDVFLYARRVGTHTRSVTPEQLPMFLDAKIRRVALGLERGVGRRCVLVATRYRDSRSIHLDTGTVKSVSVLENVVILTVDVKEGAADVPVPLDHVSSVCQTGDVWHVYLNGVVKPVLWGRDVPSELRALTYFFDPLG